MASLRTELLFGCGLAVTIFLASPCRAQMAVGDYTISGEAVVGGMPSHRNGSRSKLEEYRDLPETLIVPELNLVIEPNKKDYFFEFGSNKTGLDDQNYQLTFGKYGLFKFEFQWDQIPHLFNTETARTPYTMNGGRYTLGSKPVSTAGTAVRDWVNSDAKQVNLNMYNGLAKFKVTYTPTPGWSFTGSYGSQNVAGKRAFGAYFGPSPGSYNITELAEPLDYQTHNIDLGGEYAGNGWTIGLKYNGSLFHNNNSSLTWDNPLNPGIGVFDAVTNPTGCRSEITYNNGTGTGPCQGRFDLYPSNQAHTLTLTGTADLPFKTHFMSTVSYGWRLQNDKFLPFTVNGCYGSNPGPCSVGKIAMPRISASDLGGDVRPLMVNATLVNRFFDAIDFKGYYRLYDYDNRSKRVSLPDGIIVNDQGAAQDPGLLTFPYSYSKQNIGLDGAYKVTRWLTAKMSYGWEKMHRNQAREVVDSNEHTFGPTLDIKPNSWLLVRMGYKRGLRDAPNYDAGRNVVIETEPEDPNCIPLSLTDRECVRIGRLAALRKFDEAARNRDQFNLFLQVSPFENLTLHGGFDFFNDRYPNSVIGVQNDINYVPSVGLVYAPLEWLSLFADYNWERLDWKMIAMDRTSTTQTPATAPLRTWRSRGRDQIHTFSIGSDVGLIKNLLKMRLQYTYSNGHSLVRASGDSVGTPATDYPAINNTWHEFLARLEYSVHKNVGIMLGYYFNNYNSTDFGVDIMKPWMGDVDTGTNVQRSIFLGDNGKGTYVAHIGFIGLKLKF